jgi:hypothetical protein
MRQVLLQTSEVFIAVAQSAKSDEGRIDSASGRCASIG